MKKFLGIVVLGFLWCNTSNADHTIDHYLVIDCNLEIQSHRYNLKEDKLGELKRFETNIRFKFNNKNLFASPRNTFIPSNKIDLHFGIYNGIDAYLKQTDQFIEAEYPKSNKHLAVRYLVYNFLDGLISRDAKIIRKDNTHVHAIIDNNSSYWSYKDDESIDIHINRVDGDGSISFKKEANELTTKYFLTATYPDQKKYSEIQRFYFKNCNLSNAKF